MGTVDAEWDDRPRRDKPWVTALMCPVLVGLAFGGSQGSELFWSVATEVHVVGHDIGALPGEAVESRPQVAFRTAFKDLSNALIVFVMFTALGLLALGGLALKLPGAPSAPIQIALAVSLMFATSLVGWEIGELLTGKSFSKAFGEATSTVCRLLVPHAVIGWVVFALAMFGIYSS